MILPKPAKTVRRSNEPKTSLYMCEPNHIPFCELLNLLHIFICEAQRPKPPHHDLVVYREELKIPAGLLTVFPMSIFLLSNHFIQPVT